MTHHYSSTERQAERGKRQVVGHTIVCECVCVCVKEKERERARYQEVNKERMSMKERCRQGKEERRAGERKEERESEAALHLIQNPKS